MLVLTRDEQKTDIFIGETIIVRVLEIDGNRVRLGILAPREVPIVRGESVRDDVWSRHEQELPE
jgi:carbon storage regulator